MAFNLPAQSALAPLKPTSPTNWTRPADWPSITDAANEVQFLVADTGLATFAINTTFSRTAAQNLLIDWGDGTTDTISTTTSVTTQHTYAVGTGTPCSRGYTTFKIRIYGSAAGVTITTARFVQLTSNVNGVIPVVNTTYGVLEAYYGDGFNPTSFQAYFMSSKGTVGVSVGNFGMLEYCKLPSSMPSVTAFNSAFDYCYNLAVLIMPTSAPNMTGFNLTFRECSNLQSVTFPSDATNINIMTNTFNSCIRLTSVTLPANLNAVTDMTQCFLNCVSLNTLSLPTFGSCTNWTSALSGCVSLVNCTLAGWTSTGVGINVATMFSSCYSLELFNFPNPVAGTTFSGTQMFNNCYSLRQMIFPTNFNASTIQTWFQNCQNLITVTFPSSVSSLVTFSSAFSGCSNLQTVTLPTTVSASLLAFDGVFSTCYSLQSMTIPSSYNLGNCTNTFSNCWALKTAVFPSGASGITSFQTTFNTCYGLESVTLPSALNSVTACNSMFANCFKLESVTFPATMNAVTTFSSTFQSCTNLTSVTLPTSATACTSFSTAFQDCANLVTITLPAAVNATMSYTSTFLRCSNLKTVTLPTTQTTGTINISSMFVGCPNLVTVNNSNLIGNNSPTGNLVDATTLTTGDGQLTSLNFSCRLSKLELQGTAANRNNLTSLRLTNTGTGGWTGTSPQINLSYTNLSASAIDQVFTDLTTVTGKTITVTGATGAATCTPSIATAKGWTVNT